MFTGTQTCFFVSIETVSVRLRIHALTYSQINMFIKTLAEGGKFTL